MRVAWMCVLLSIPLSGAWAQERERAPVEHYDIWTDLQPGIRYLRRTTTAPCTLHVLELDLREPGIELVSSSYEERWQTVAQFGRDHNLAASINGGFWQSMASPGGLQVHEGERWRNSKDNVDYGWFGYYEDGRARIGYPEDVIEDVPGGMQHAVSGRPLLIRDGEVDTPSIDPIETANYRQPRSAAGVSRNGRKVWLVVTDGRQEHSTGMTLYEMARTLHELGAWRGINLDGGGSSTIWVDRLGGVINTPSGSRWERRLGFGAQREEGEETGRVRYTKSGRPMVYVRGVEREVMNSIGVRAPVVSGPPPMVRTAPLDMPADIPAVVALPPRTSSLRMGRWLEAFPQTVCVGVLLLLALWVRRYFKFEKHISNVNESRDSDA